jgi:ribosomal protein S12 methylthiotransferase accessory factor
MTGDRGTGFTQRDSKKIPQFAPNFTVYTLPPDVVCLYSEDRKFFLHGELYCALASAIVEGGRSVRELIRGLEREFPSDKIAEALKRLVDRRHVLLESCAFDDTVAAYWASLGLSPSTAERNLQSCRVRMQAVDVQGATELSDALSGLGVRVVKRSPDLTVTLVNDYLEGRRRSEPATFIGPYALAPRATFRHFSPGWASVTSRQERLLDLSC